ncbi:MAG: hypothetical protein COV07_03905 [Candidatus Vogelbacteria bacterium CG10_big_fil_rev_8_21_14_0_10_45_14]|uniref:Type II toxin-antitoxin system HicA family toxin n=1 Tax=Candidatus Vogelbacteria bacterium CG10_big_fil_rev_8_21_14_0_10_45_14 TaxID=1975042 RepID=A0A2H0RJ06_9BACT|nr:MAG: hypothetical protein COV07_03905 [Candidatus Vogelbacteria bacterium CG10_big_fil_rev_8_21_14_0_10_45_14]
MDQLPILSSARLVKTLSLFGYCVQRQTGSHMRLHAKGRRPVTVPNYKSIDRSLLKKILNQANIPQEEFMTKVLKK